MSYHIRYFTFVCKIRISIISAVCPFHIYAISGHYSPIHKGFRGHYQFSLFGLKLNVLEFYFTSFIFYILSFDLRRKQSKTIARNENSQFLFIWYFKKFCLLKNVQNRLISLWYQYWLLLPKSLTPCWLLNTAWIYF